MAADFERDAFVGSLQAALEAKDTYAKMAAELARTRQIKRVYLVGCGAPHRASANVKYWAEHYAKELDVRLYYPAEFIALNPPKLDEHTLVILASHSGTTPEVLQAAEMLQSKPCITIGISQKPDSPLAQVVQHPVAYGVTTQGYYAGYMMQQAMVGAILKEQEGWTLHDEVMAAFDYFPAALADSIVATEARATEEARIYKDDRFVYALGAGPCYNTAYVYAVCYLMEMQWMHGAHIESAEFFHGPFEVMDQNTPFVILLGEDPARPLSERVVRFVKKYTERTMIYDSRDYEMAGVPAQVRPFFAPFVLQAVLTRQVQHLAVWHNHPLSDRRYMWKMEY